MSMYVLIILLEVCILAGVLPYLDIRCLTE